MFEIFSKAVHDRYNHLAKNELYVVDIEDIFQSYLNFFPDGTNEIYRERTVHDCNCCKQFIRRLGNLVAFGDNGTILTVWDDHDLPAPYNTVGQKMAELVRQAPILRVFRTKEPSFGTEFNWDGKTNHKYFHFHGKTDRKHLNQKPDEAIGERNAIKDVMTRGLNELTNEALDQIIELIEAKSLYRGEEHLAAVKGFRDLKGKYDVAPSKSNFIWANLDNRFGRFRNTAIGTLAIDLSGGMDLEQAVRLFESKVAPQNYKRTSSLITQKMVDQAETTLTELGLEHAIHRRFAKIEDLSINDVLWASNDSKPVMKGGLSSLLGDSISSSGSVDIKSAIPISIDDFLTQIIPGSESLELMFKNEQSGNLVSITAGDGIGKLFKWNNNFAWSYNGEVADSIRERVKKAGGNVNAKLRVSLAWHNADDLDLHAHCPEGHVSFQQKMRILDVDMNGMDKHDSVNPVENLSWSEPKKGNYIIQVHQYSKRADVNPGFDVEFFYLGQTHTYTYSNPVRQNETIELFRFQITSEGLKLFNQGTALKGTSGSQNIWGIQTEKLIPVQLVMTSPNHWEDSNKTGNKHWFFILKDCINPEPTRGIYNEFLRSDLDKHRKVFEVLGSKTKCPATNEQVSGVGFSSTRNDEVVIVSQKGNQKKAYKVQF